MMLAQQRRLLPHAAASLRSVGRQRLAVTPRAAGKGFGAQTSKSKRQEEGRLVEGQSATSARRLKNKGKQMARQLQPMQQPAGAPLTQEEGESLVEAMEFNQRLAALKQEAEQKKAALRQQQNSNLLDSAKATELYDNPPPLTQTLLGGKQEPDRSLAEYDNGTFGPSQAGLAIAAVLLGIVFVVVSGGSDLGYATRRPSQQAATEAAQALPEEQRKEVEGQLAGLQARLKEDSSDLEALEGAAVLNVKLGNLQAAREQLQSLTKARPEDPEAWRVLAETQGALGDRSAAVKAYRQAWEASGRGSLDMLTGLAGALLADGQGEQAVAVVQEARSSSSAADLGDTELQLLLGKTYSQWRGHQADALATFDGIIAASPEDFRAYLAKGLLLRDVGRLGDAQRYFLQAKYYAPAATRPTVEALIANGS